MIDFNITTTPLDHQLSAVSHISPRKVGALFMDMGTGKSLTAIMLAHAKRERISKIVWCCPVSLKRNTVAQIFEHTDCIESDVYIFNSKTKPNTTPTATWYVVGIESIGSSSREVVALNHIVDENTMVIIDESGYIKGHRAKRTKRITAISERSRYRYILNGTPISQGIEDLFSQFYFLSPKILRYTSWYSFRRAHIIYSERYKGMIDARRNTDLISERIAPFTYQVTKDECLSLPDKIETHYHCLPTKTQIDMADSAKERFYDDIMELESEDTGVAIYRLFGALRAIASGVVPAGFNQEGDSLECNKIDLLRQSLDQCRDKHIIVWCEYQRNVSDICGSLPNAIRYDGSVPERKRDSILSDWRENGGVLVATTGTGGHGLTLTEASTAIFYSSNFKYANDIQAQDRIHRIGQNKPCHYIRLWTECGIEDRIHKALTTKGDALKMFRQEVKDSQDLVRFM